jgi:hypothetical protein
MSNQLLDSAEREKWIGLLDAAAEHPPDTINDEWAWLLGELGLPKDHFLYIVEALRQGRWRTAKNPRSYLKTVARREASKALRSEEKEDPIELLKSNPSKREFSMEVALGDLSYQSETSEALKGAGGIWRRGGGLEAYQNEKWEEDDDGNPIRTYRDRLLSKVPAMLKQIEKPSAELKALYEELNEQTTDYHYHARSFVHPDWNAWASAAGLDEWEQKVMEYRLEGVSRDRAMQMQTNGDARKALQAAWRKFDRQGLRRLQDAAKKV